MQGQISDAPTVNIVVNQQWLEVRALIVETLRPYPEARVVVATALQELEAASAG